MAPDYAKPPEIIVRDRRIARRALPRRWWAGGSPFATAMFNSLSLSFPRGEAFFVDSVRACRADAPQRLAEEIRAFISQEVNHSREHLAFNRMVSDTGYAISAIDADVERALSASRGRAPLVNLAATMALEHITAIFAHELLVDPIHLAGAERDFAELWRWHAIEEIEHKAVAFDVYMHAARAVSPARRWRLRAIMMLLATARFARYRYRGAVMLLRQDGITGPRAHFGLLRYLMGKPGIVRRVFPAWLAFFRPGFHPWHLDDRHLIQQESAAPPRQSLAR